MGRRGGAKGVDLIGENHFLARNIGKWNQLATEQCVFKCPGKQTILKRPS